MGSIVSSIIGGGGNSDGGGVGGIDDLKRGLTDQSNELLVGLGPTREARQAQVQSFTQALADQAAGKGPSLAEQALKAAQDRNMKMQLAAARSNRAINPALAARQVQRAGAEMAQQTAQQAAQMRLQERNQAQQLFGNHLNSQQQLAANVRNMAMGGANAQANLQQADVARGDRYTGALIQGGASLAAGGATGGGAKPMHDGGIVKGYSDGGMAKFLASASKSDGKSFAGTGKVANVTGGEAVDVESPTLDLSGMFAKKPEQMNMMTGSPVDNVGIGVQKPAERLMGVKQTLQAAQGAVVPGRAPVKGDSAKNDVVPAMLSPGEIVIPRSVVAEGPKSISKFAAAILAKEGKPQKLNKGGMVKPSGYASVLAAREEFKAQQAELNRKFGKK
jgi:hypothetical protein